VPRYANRNVLRHHVNLFALRYANLFAHQYANLNANLNVLLYANPSVLRCANPSVLQCANLYVLHLHANPHVLLLALRIAKNSNHANMLLAANAASTA
jgi:hypothetical protein